jgi:D-sedoheptulose 7-phosphate isomerase
MVNRFSVDDIYEQFLREHMAVFARMDALRGDVVRAGQRLIETIRKGHKILICGNGGSAADAQHFAAELVGRFQKERQAWPCVALTANTSILSAIGNDYGFGNVFARQVEGLARPGDLLIGISTSGSSENVLRAVEIARSKGVGTIGLLGGDGGSICGAVDLALIIPSKITAHIQEAHIFVLHAWCGMIEAGCAESTPE